MELQSKHLCEGSFVVNETTKTVSMLRTLRIFEASTLQHGTDGPLSYAFWRDLRPATKSEITITGHENVGHRAPTSVSEGTNPC